jgi:hypothetical protein
MYYKKTTKRSNHNSCDPGHQENGYNVSPEELIAKIESRHDSTIYLVDFDETLWLRNSTEEFLASIKPHILVSIVLQFLSFIKPWKWRSGQNPEHHKDLLRLKVILYFAPWAVQRWDSIALDLGPKYLNKDLLKALTEEPDNKIHIVSYGYDFIISPLLKAIDPQLQLTVSASLDSAMELRLKGKGYAVKEVIGEIALKRSTCITDSLLDVDLLKMAKVGLLCEWPRAKYVQAGRSPMLPLIYSTKIKRPKTNYFLRAIIGQDYTLLLLAFSLVSSDPVICSISLLFFLISYFCTYEIGYYENDRLAHKYENKPRVSEEFSSYLGCFKPWFAWLWGIIFSVPAAWLASSEISWIPSALDEMGR